MMNTIGYYFENWNTDFISLSILVNIILLLSGYFYGKIFQKFIKPLRKMDCSVLGIFFIFAIFQIFIYFNLGTNGTTSSAYVLFWILLVLGIILCLILRVNVKPKLVNLFSILVGIFITVVLCVSSSKFTTNNTYFDTISYLSQVIEGSARESFAHMGYASGTYLNCLYPIHDYTGYYFFWSMILKAVRDIFTIKESMTPLYIWGATILYGMSLGNLVANSVNVLYQKHKKIIGIIVVILILSPYYSNYFNTTLAFFGNTIRTVAIGMSMLVVYLYTKSKNTYLFIPLMCTYYAGISMTSSCFFINAFIVAGIFFYMCFTNETRFKHWILFIISCLPIFHYAILFISPTNTSYFKMMLILIALMIVLLVVAYLVRNHLDIVCKIGKILLPVVLVGLIGLSFLKRNSEYGYSYFFAIRSIDDMGVNVTTHIDHNELVRNIIFYILVIGQFINFKYHSKYKFFLLTIVVLFLNPLVCPAICNYLTTAAYARAFDLFTNPFVMAFMIQNFEHLTSFKYANYALAYGGMLVAGIISAPMAMQSLTIPYSKTLEPPKEGYNFEYKVTEDDWQVYDYISTHLAHEGHEPYILSQDISMKGYVPNIILTFSSTDFRSSLAQENYGENRDLVLMFYPSKKYGNDGSIGDDAEFSKLYQVVNQNGAEYVVMSNTLSIYDERGWYEKTYAKLEHKGYFDKIFENDSWVVLKVNKDYIPDADDLGEVNETEN